MEKEDKEQREKLEALTKYWDDTESEAEDNDNKGNKKEDLDAPNKADEDQGYQREDYDRERKRTQPLRRDRP